MAKAKALMNLGGRPSKPVKLDEECQAKIIALLQRGNYIATACRAVGISRETFYTWLENGEGREVITEDGTVIVYDKPAYVEFREKVQVALALAEISLVHSARKGLDGWQAQMTMLERRFPQRWGRKDMSFNVNKTEVTGPNGGPVRIEVDVRAKIMSMLHNGAVRLKQGETLIDVGKEPCGQQVVSVLPDGDAGSREGAGSQQSLPAGVTPTPVELAVLGEAKPTTPTG